MTTINAVIDEIIPYGLQPNLAWPDKEKKLEHSLVKLYSIFFDVAYAPDEKEYPDFDRSGLPDIRSNITANFPGFGLYKTILDIHDLASQQDMATGDAVDDLHDIIADLLEVKWRMAHNSEDDGCWYFEFIFQHHTRQHVINLLNYLNQRE
mgnify:CR=1 FL=1